MKELNIEKKGKGCLVMKGPAVEDNLPQIIHAANALLEQFSCPQTRRRDIDAILDDECSNIVDYAYDEEAVAAGSNLMTVTCRVAPGWAEFEFRNQGSRFNPLEAVGPEESCEPQLGGLGIYIIKSLSDRVEYAYEEGCNVLTVGVGWQPDEG